ncbi:MAG: GerAB/ArcD/ProY family transporter [Eubacteriales bacterium]|jgi:hypothetical protein
MEKNYSLGLHRVCLLSLFLFGIVINKITDGGSGLLWLLVGTPILLLLLPLFLPVFDKLYGIESAKSVDRTSKKVGLAAIYILTGLYALWTAYYTSFLYADFIASIMIPGTPVFWVQLLFVLVCLWLAMKEPTVIFKVALVSFAAVVLSALLLFAVSVPHFVSFGSLFKNLDFGRLADFNLDNPVLRFFLPLPVILVFFTCTSCGTGKKSVYIGTAAGALLFGLSMLQLLLIFDEKYLATLNYPYLSSVSVLAGDEVFLRLDGLVYAILYVCFFLKCSVCLHTIRLLAQKFSRRLGFYVTPVCAALIVLLPLLA